MSGLASLVRIS